MVDRMTGYMFTMSIYPRYVRDIVMYITCLEVRYVSGSCVNIIWFLSHLSKPVDISWICLCHCYVYNEYRRQVCWWFLCEIVINIVMYITSVFSTCWWYFPEITLWSVVWYFGRVWQAILDRLVTLLCI